MKKPLFTCLQSHLRQSRIRESRRCQQQMEGQVQQKKGNDYDPLDTILNGPTKPKMG
jgi:hypothetical protein